MSSRQSELDRPTTSFMLFFKEVRSEVQVQHPGVQHSEMSRVIAKRWHGLQDSQKLKYNEKAERIQRKGTLMMLMTLMALIPNELM